MKIGAKLFGTKATRDALKRMAKAAELTANEVTVDGAERLVEIIQRLIRTGPKTGRVYERANPPRMHQASAPGQAPADDMGHLAASFYAEFTKLNQYAWRATAGSDLAYARLLEEGDATTNLLPRPYVSVAVGILESEMGGLVSEAWAKHS